MSQLEIELKAFAEKHATEPLPPETKAMLESYKPHNLKVFQEMQRWAVLRGAEFITTKLGLSPSEAEVLKDALKFMRANLTDCNEALGDKAHKFELVDDLTERLCVYL